MTATTMHAMQQGGGGASPAEQAQEAQAAAAEARARALEAAVEARAAAEAAGQAGPNEAVVRVGPDGPLVIRDGPNGDMVVIDEGAIPPWLNDGPPVGVFMIPITLFICLAFIIVGLPIARAFARRMDSRNAMQAAVAPSAELRQLQTSIDTMAVEIERMSEHQRFLTRVLAERTGESLPAARPGAPASRS